LGERNGRRVEVPGVKKGKPRTSGSLFKGKSQCKGVWEGTFTTTKKSKGGPGWKKGVDWCGVWDTNSLQSPPDGNTTHSKKTKRGRNIKRGARLAGGRCQFKGGGQ